MEYFAFFLDGDEFLEKRLALMRCICYGETKSYPHITVRLFSSLNKYIEDDLSKKTCSNITIIEPGEFGISDKTPPYVVYLRCESEDVERIEYKPDFPCSRLHVTIYEGDDYDFAQRIHDIICRLDWHISLSFRPVRPIEKREIGKHTNDYPDFKELFNDVLGTGWDEFCDNSSDCDYRCKLVERLVKEIQSHIDSQEVQLTDSLYLSEPEGVVTYSNQMVVSVADDPADYKTKDIYITPPELAKDMAFCAYSYAEKSGLEGIDFGDSSVGTGSLFLALKYLIDEKNAIDSKSAVCISSAIGIDVNQKMAGEAAMKCSKRGMKVINADALLCDEYLGEMRNLMLVNPPFSKNSKIPVDYRKLLIQKAKEITGIDVSANAGLYVYHVLIMHKWLCKNGIAVWLLPSTFLQTKFGRAVREYLLYNVELLRIHVYDESLKQFEKAMVSTAIVVFRNASPTYNSIDISYGPLLSITAEGNEQSNVQSLNRDVFVDHIDNWRMLIDFQNQHIGEKSLKIGDLFTIKRGLATGANSFFVMSQETADEKGIPDCALKPVLPKARFITSNIIEADKIGNPILEPRLVVIDSDMPEQKIKELYPSFFSYLNEAKRGGKDAVTNRYLVKKRPLWYQQEKRAVAPFLLTYMGRRKGEKGSPLRFLWNKSNAVALNTYLCLYPKKELQEKLDDDPSLYERVLEALNTTAVFTVSSYARVYSGGLLKIEPKTLSEIPLYGLDEFLNS